MKRLFEKALVCPPSDNYPHAISTHPESMSINLKLALTQHEAYVSLLRSHGVSVEALKPQNPLPDSVFIQDPALVGKNTVLIGRSREPSRQPEAEIVAEYFMDHDKNVKRVGPDSRLEGGDVLVTEDTVFVGVSGRTNHEGLREVQRYFSGIEVKPVKFSSEFFHLLSACSYLADDQLLICDRYVDASAFQGFELLSVAPDDVVAVNVLHLGESRILMPRGYSRVMDSLRDWGYVPIEIENSEFIKGDGRITCLSLPFYTNLE